MSIIADTRRALARLIGPREETGPVDAQREAGLPIGVNIDPDDHLYRRLTQSRRDLPQVTQTRMQDLASWLWQSNLLARQLIEMPIAFLLARGVRIAVADEKAQARIDAWWADPITDVPLRLPEWMRGMRIFGEQCWPRTSIRCRATCASGRSIRARSRRSSPIPRTRAARSG